MEFDTSAHRISGTAELTLPSKGAKKCGFILNRAFTVSRMEISGEAVVPEMIADYDVRDVSPDYGVYGEWGADNAALWAVEIPKALRKKDSLTLLITWSGSLYTPPDDREFSREKIAFEVDGTIGSEGIFLSPSSWWYPRLPDSPATHDVTVRLPKGWNAVTAGAPEWKDEGDWTVVRHISDQVTDGINLSAGPYVIESVTHEGTKIMTYFLPGQAELSGGYAESCRRYVSMYSEMIAPYPFPKFAVADNFLPSGYGMPGWTLLGSEVLRLPFIRFTSLGHEVLHNWFGNSLMVDYRGGNWCEGLTAYLADYTYKEAEDSLAGVEYRMNTLRDFANYVNAENDYPVAEFVSRVDAHDRAIGYGKALMIFHMLRRMQDMRDSGMFRQTISTAYRKHQWQAISWGHWQAEFEAALGQRLDWYFKQWILQPGAPGISIGKVAYDRDDTGWQADCEIITEPARMNFKYLLPIRITEKNGDETDKWIFIQEPNQKVRLSGTDHLAALQLDPGFDVFRRIYPAEMPVTMAAFFGDGDAVLVVPSSGPHVDAYSKAAEGLKKDGQSVMTDDEISETEMHKSLWIFGSQNRIWKRFYPEGSPYAEKMIAGEVSTFIMQHQSTAGKTIVFTDASPEENPVGGTRKLPHYGKYSFLVFDGETNIDKGTWQASGDCPMNWRMVE